MWDVPNPPPGDVRAWIDEVEQRIRKEDTQLFVRIEFAPGSSDDSQVVGHRAVSLPWLRPPLIIFNTETNAQDKETFQRSLAHELGHCADHLYSAWRWHLWKGDDPFPEDEKRNKAAYRIMDQASEFFASGYAEHHGFMEHRRDIVDWVRALVLEVDVILHG